MHGLSWSNWASQLELTLLSSELLQNFGSHFLALVVQMLAPLVGPPQGQGLGTSIRVLYSKLSPQLIL